MCVDLFHLIGDDGTVGECPFARRRNATSCAIGGIDDKNAGPDCVRFRRPTGQTDGLTPEIIASHAVHLQQLAVVRHFVNATSVAWQ
jgi:hypothetical protein